MTRTRPALAIAAASALTVLCASWSVGCGTDVTPATRTASDAAASLPPVSLPDLSQLAESVQRQVRGRYAALTKTLDGAAASEAERAAAYGALGRVLMAAKFNKEAESCYRHAEALAPADSRWPYFLGHVYLRNGDRAGAADRFTRASSLQPSNATILIWLGETNLDDGRPEIAQPIFERALSVQPQSAAALFGAGRAALARQAYTDAVQFMERALAADPRATAIHYPLAMAYRGTGDVANAEAHVRQRGNVYPALADSLLQPDADVLESAVAYETRGMQALRAADWPAAETAFRRGLELEPGAASLRYWLGATLLASGNAAGAELEFAAVVRQSPDFANAHFSLGMIAVSRGRHQDAIRHLEAAVKSDPKLPEAHFRLGDSLRATGQLNAAFTEYETAVRLDPNIVDAWIGGARSLAGLGRDQHARDWLAQARRIHPNRPELADLQGRLTTAR